MNTLSPGTSRFAATALLVVVVLAVVFYGVIPLYKHYSTQTEKITSLENNLARFRYLVDNREVIEKESQRIARLERDGDLFLKGDKKAIASANLRALLTDIVKRSGGQLLSSQEYEAAVQDSAVAVGLRLQFGGEIEQLVDLLFELENARPLIFIDDLTVTSSSSRSRRRVRTSSARPARNSTRASRSLDIRLDVVAYMPGDAK